MTTTRSLIPHPVCRNAPEDRVIVTACGTPETLSLTYRIECRSSHPILPAPSPDIAQPTDGLWQRTCCELFMKREGCLEYREFNFSPSGQWAAYAFSSERERDPSPGLPWRRRIPIEFRRLLEGFELSVDISADQWPVGSGDLQLGLSVVLEVKTEAEENPQLVYWALCHPGPQPDFHHPDAFSLTLSGLC